MIGYIVLVKGLSTDPSPHSATKSASSSRSPRSHPLFSKCRGHRRLRNGRKRTEPEQVRFPKLAMDYNIGWNESQSVFLENHGFTSRRKTPADAPTETRIRVWHLAVKNSRFVWRCSSVSCTSGGPVDMLLWETTNKDVALLNTHTQEFT
jgi:hypothetical protein